MDCCAQPEKGSDRTSCPRCGQPGRKVDEVTLKSLLRPAALERRSESSHRFCATSACPVVYFDSEEVFDRDELSVPVFQKEESGDAPVCYCFGIGAANIHREIEATGRSTAEQRIRSLVKAGRCACELRNPQGSCCLGNVARVALKAEQALRVDQPAGET